MINSQIAEIFREIASILEIKGDNRFRIRAYERAAQQIEGLSEDLGSVEARGALRDIPGIGEDLASKIREFIKTGLIKAHAELKKSIPAGVLELLDIPTIGPKTAKLLFEQLNIVSVEGLQEAIAEGRLYGVSGIKEKTVENLAKGIALLKQGRQRMTLGQAVEEASVFLRVLEKMKEVSTVSVAGSLRRRKETVRDIDILVVSSKPQRVMDAFISIPSVKEVIARGQTKSSIRTAGGMQVDCRVVENASFGAALVYFTGSKNFNIRIRQIALRQGLKINEYGVFRAERMIAGSGEKDVFASIGMSYVPPEMREDTGEVERALKGALPSLIERKDIRGDLHTHSSWSDGISSIPEMAQAASERGYEYIALTDHSQGLKVAHGLSPEALKQKKKEIASVQSRFKGLRILYGTEVDIDAQGLLDYPDSVLKEFDFVVAAVHSGFKQSSAQITRRIVRACRSRYVHCIAHPTGRLWGAREAYPVDFDAVARAAADTNTFLEINAYPQRLDLNDMHARRARELGARLAINTDSHRADQLDNIAFGISVARRGWLGKDDVVNCLPLERFLRALKKR